MGSSHPTSPPPPSQGGLGGVREHSGARAGEEMATRSRGGAWGQGYGTVRSSLLQSTERAKKPPGPFLGHLTAPSSGISFTVLCAQDLFDIRGLRAHGLLQHVARMWCWQCCPLGGRPWPRSILGGVGSLAKGWLQAQDTTVVLGLSEGGEGDQVSGVPN